MKIVLVYLGRKGAGPEYAFEMAKALSSKANVLCVISSYISNRNNWLSLANENSSVEIKELKTYNSIAGFIVRSFDFWAYANVICAINNFAPDMIYSPMGHFWEKFIVPFCKCKYTIKTIHDVVLHKGEDSYIHKFLNSLFSYKTYKYVILSDIFKVDLEKKGIDEKNIIVIPHAVFKEYASVEQQRDYTQYNRFLFFGRIIKYKGIEVLLSSMQIVLKKCPNARLVIAGNGDVTPYKDLMNKYMDNLELHLGWIADSRVADFFKDIDFVVLPYTHASQSGVIPLSYAFGKPVIATKIGGIPEQVEDGDTGILVSPNDEVELGNVIGHLLSNPETLVKMKSNCYDYALHNTWDTSAQKLIDAYLESSL